MSAGNCFELNFESGRTTLGSSCDFALAWGGCGICTDFFSNPGALQGDIPWPSWQKRATRFPCLLEENTFPLLPEGSPPSAPCPWFLSEIGKDQRALTEPKGLPSCLGAWESLQKEK